jgi:hypothetical protein
VEKIVDHRKADKDKGWWELRAKWEGYASDEDTWEPYNNMKDDIPEKVQEYKKLHPTLGVGLSPEAEMIVSHKKYNKADGGWLLKVRYKGYASKFDSWESLNDMKNVREGHY